MSMRSTPRYPAKMLKVLARVPARRAGWRSQRRPIIYLAAPYSDASAKVRLRRFALVNEAAAELATTGRIVFSPITMTHPLDLVLANDGETLGSDYWLKFDEAFMDLCSELIVLRLQGWERSKGVKREIAYFRRRGLPVSFIDPKPSAVERL